MQSKASTVKEYLAGLPEDRRKALEAIRKVIKANLDPKYKEGIQYGMIGYYVPHSVYPAGYHCDPKQPVPYVGLASQKNHMAIYLFCVYCADGEVERFQKEWKQTGKKLDMGKSCVRFKKLEDVALDVIGDTIARAPVERFVAHYEASRDGTWKSARKVAKKRSSAKKAAGTGARKATKRATKKVAKKVARKVTRKATKKAGR